MISPLTLSIWFSFVPALHSAAAATPAGSISTTCILAGSKVNDSEIANYAKSRNLCDDVIRVIANNREWTRSYQVKIGLASNPKCPAPTAMKFVNHLQDRDLRFLMKSKDVPSAVSNHARRLLAKKGKI